MPAASSQRPRLLLLADRLEGDIRARRLKAGDAYLTTAEAARMLQVNGNLANRALQLLVQRGRLERRQRRGSFVAEAQTNGHTSPLARVHLVVHQRYLRAEGLLADGTIIGMQQELPGVEVDFNFLPSNDCADYVSRLVSDALRTRTPEGFVLVRAPLEAHRQIHASGLPTVVHGTVYPAVTQLSSIDVDHRAKAQLLVDYLLRRGHRRFAVLLRETQFPGDHALLDGLFDALTAAQVSCGAVRVRSVANDRTLIAATLDEILASGDGSLGVICRSQPLAEAVLAAAPKGKRKRFEVAACDVYSAGPAPLLPFAYTRNEASAMEVGARIGRMLARQTNGGRLKAEHEVMSVVLQPPAQS
jgi:DNA-binding transcriptional regulator YhcF (GntR family)